MPGSSRPSTSFCNGENNPESFIESLTTNLANIKIEDSLDINSNCNNQINFIMAPPQVGHFPNFESARRNNSGFRRRYKLIKFHSRKH